MFDMPSDAAALRCDRCRLDVPSFLAFVGPSARCPKCDGPLVAPPPADDTVQLGPKSPAPPAAPVAPEPTPPPRRVVPWPTLPTELRPPNPDWC